MALPAASVALAALSCPSGVPALPGDVAAAVLWLLSEPVDLVAAPNNNHGNGAARFPADGSFAGFRRLLPVRTVVVAAPCAAQLTIASVLRNLTSLRCLLVPGEVPSNDASDVASSYTMSPRWLTNTLRFCGAGLRSLTVFAPGDAPTSLADIAAHCPLLEAAAGNVASHHGDADASALAAFLTRVPRLRQLDVTHVHWDRATIAAAVAGRRAPVTVRCPPPSVVEGRRLRDAARRPRVFLATAVQTA